MMNKGVKNIILLIVLVIGLVFLGISIGDTHNNSAPNFECMLCHKAEKVSEIDIKIEGLPKAYIPGKTYRLALTITSGITSLGDNAGGFAVRASAGELRVMDKKNTQLSNGILTHTQEGAALRKWTFGWKAPAEKMEVSLKVMGVAADGDFSPAGDIVGFDRYTIK